MDKIKPEESIPFTDTHIITKEDLIYAYYKGYLDGIKRSLFKFTTEEVKDGKNSTPDL